MRPARGRFPLRCPMRPLQFVPLVALVVAGCSASRETAVVRPPVATTPAVAPPEYLPDPAATPAPSAAPVAGTSDYDTVRAGRFDGGKMWTFDAPPAAFFRETYGIPADTAWFRRARLGALRFATYCSASFVSPGGLVLTNHHCARESVEKASRAGERLLERGFSAKALAEERTIPDLYVDQLVGLRDVTDDVRRGLGANLGPEAEADALGNAARGLQERLDAEAKRRDAGTTVQVVALYDGARYAAYTFRRYKDVRLVMAPELDLGFFGGDPDNFTYPRYSLDYAFFRVYDGGRPLAAQNYFRVAPGGVRAGDAVFVVGNPGSTNRLASLAQWAYEREVTLPTQIAALDRRLAVIDAYFAANPAAADSAALRNARFDLSNARKSTAGALAGLRDPYLVARKAAAERALQEGIAGNADLRARYGRTLDELARLQTTKRAEAPRASAFTFFGGDAYDSPTLLRAFYGFYLDLLRRAGQTGEAVTNAQREARKLPYWPEPLERQMLALRLTEIRDALGESDVVVRRILGGRTPEAAAADLLARTTLRDSTKVRAVLDRGLAASGDAMTDVAQAVGGLFLQNLQQQEGVEGLESGLRANLARARFTLAGDAVPPDASFSLRIADGRVAGYEYNGTRAPAYTTFHGLFDRHASNPGDRDFALPERWTGTLPGFDRNTPLNLVTTADITGGNSGSPLLNADLALVGLVFDSNVEALPNEYLYRSEAGRSVAVDVRAILETLDDVYDMDRLVLELTRGTVAPTEAEADNQRR